VNDSTVSEIGCSWPEPLTNEAYYGIAGEIVASIAPQTEADPAAVLLHFLVACGNLAGRNPYFVVNGTKHHLNLNAVCVGSTASRKGTAKDDVLFVLRGVDTKWSDSCVQSGLSSGEGLIFAVRDPIEARNPIREKGRVRDYETIIADPGVNDKRL